MLAGPPGDRSGSGGGMGLRSGRGVENRRAGGQRQRRTLALEDGEGKKRSHRCAEAGAAFGDGLAAGGVRAQGPGSAMAVADRVSAWAGGPANGDEELDPGDLRTPGPGFVSGPEGLERPGGGGIEEA